MNYIDFLQRKTVRQMPSGFTPMPVNEKLFEWQGKCTEFAIRRGRAALFEDCGLGKTAQQLEWARQVHEHTNKPVLILAPLAVSAQTKNEGEKFGIDVHIARSGEDVVNGINITNYEILHKFDPSVFEGVVLDESSILKSYMGKTKRMIVESFKDTPYRLACSATPAPNDLMELLNHAEFLGVMRSNEALSIWFIADQANSGKYRLKGHAEADFWDWVASWAICMEKPSDIGYSDEGYILPELNVHDIVLKTEQIENGRLRDIDMSATGFYREKAFTAEARTKETARLAHEMDGQCVIWCDTNDEADRLKALIPDAVEIRGADKPERKESAAVDFVKGNIRVLISKPTIFGYGLNFQNCHKTIFCGLDYSFENYYQAVRRFHRFGQQNAVDVYRVLGDTESNILATIERKAAMKANMQVSMAQAMKQAQISNLKGLRTFHMSESRNNYDVPTWLRSVI